MIDSAQSIGDQINHFGQDFHPLRDQLKEVKPTIDELVSNVFRRNIAPSQVDDLRARLEECKRLEIAIQERISESDATASSLHSDALKAFCVDLSESLTELTRYEKALSVATYCPEIRRILTVCSLHRAEDDQEPTQAERISPSNQDTSSRDLNVKSDYANTSSIQITKPTIDINASIRDDSSSCSSDGGVPLTEDAATMSEAVAAESPARILIQLKLTSDNSRDDLLSEWRHWLAAAHEPDVQFLGMLEQYHLLQQEQTEKESPSKSVSGSAGHS